MSPTIFIPDAMTERPASAGGESLRMGTFSVVGFVKIDIAGTYDGSGERMMVRGSKLASARSGRISGKRRGGGTSRGNCRLARRVVRHDGLGQKWCGLLGGTATRREHLTHLLVATVHARQGNLQRVDATVIALELRDTP